jgi:hypothetical protein
VRVSCLLKSLLPEQVMVEYEAPDDLASSKSGWTTCPPADGCHAVTRYEPDCDKIMRMHAQAALIENGHRR